MKSLIAASVAVCVFAIPAQANTINGELWHVPEATAQNATIANTPGTTPDVTFQVNTPLNFSVLSPPPTVAQWLTSGSAFNVVQNTAGTLASPMDNFSTGTFVDFKGNVTVTNGMTFTAEHDDGLQLMIGGLMVIDAPGPTSPTLTTVTYTGPSGTFAFNLSYGECCSGQSIMKVNLPFEAVPGPIAGAGIPGLVAGCFALVGLARRRRQQA